MTAKSHFEPSNTHQKATIHTHNHAKTSLQLSLFAFNLGKNTIKMPKQTNKQNKQTKQTNANNGNTVPFCT
jgi:hypothetical protein